MDTVEAENPLVTALNSLRAKYEEAYTSEDIVAFEEEQRQATARSVLATSFIPKRYRDAKPTDFDPDSRVYKYAMWVKPNAKGAFIEGVTGAGKTHAACAIANWYARHGRSVRFVQSVDLVNALMHPYSESDRDLVRQARNASLLVIDDLGKEAVTAKTLPEIYGFIDARYANRRTTVITTNYSPTQLQSRYEQIEPETGLAIMRRISEMTLGMEVSR